MVWFSWVSPAVEALTVSGISRNSGSVDGGESVVVTGTDFITYTTGGTTIENKTSGSGTYTVPSDTISMKIEVWGAGGNGGDGVSFQNNNTYFYFPGAGGGGGGYTTRTFTNPTANTTVSYEVGAGGGGTSKATYSTYTSLIAYGGSNGSNALSGSYSSNSSTGFASWNFSGGGGGAASGGGTTSDNKQGADGGSAVGSNIYCVQSISSGAGGASANGGSGGSAVSGPLGRTVSSGSPCGGGISDTNVSGNVGLVIGGGGSGGLGGINNPQDNADGGIGARGQVRISTTRSDYRNPDPVVKFGTVTATCTVNSNTQMTCSAPAGTGTVAVTVGGVAAGNYTYYVAPTVTGVTTATGAGVTKTYTVKSNGQWPNATIGTNRTTRTVAIAGTGFVDVSAVVVGGVACSSYTVNSASSITCTLPTTVRSGAFLVQVTTPGGTSASSGELGVVGIVYVPAPVVSYVAVPTDGTVKINGERKDNLSGTTWTPNVSTRASVYGVYDDIDRFITFHDNDYIKLTMGGQTCEVSAWGSQEILCDMPNWGSAGNKAIQVSNAYGTSNTDVYVTAVAGPTITGVTPGTGVLTTGGTVLTITGTGFQTSFTVTVGGVECASKEYVSGTTVSCTTPAGVSAGTREVVVRTGYGTSNGFGVGFIEPYIKLSSDKPSATVTVNPTTTGTTATDHLTLITDTNYPKGFTLKITQGASGTNLTCSSGAGAGATLPITTDSVSTLSMNSWGLGVGTSSAVPTTWRAVSNTPLNLDSLNTAGSKTTHLYYGARLDYGTPACSYYVGAVVISASVIP